MSKKALKSIRAKDNIRNQRADRIEKLRIFNATHDLRERGLRIYGLTRETYDAMLREQGGVCAICHDPPTALRRGKPDPLCVDHNHSTGEVRGLLCRSCNSGFGMFRDDPEIVGSAHLYAKKHAALPVNVPSRIIVPFSQVA